MSVRRLIAVAVPVLALVAFTSAASATGARQAGGTFVDASGNAVGWVSLAPRPAYDRLTHAKVLAPVDDQPVWSIVCFVVSRKARGKGIATALLDGAIDAER